MKRLLFPILIVFIGLFAFSCGDDDDDATPSTGAGNGTTVTPPVIGGGSDDCTADFIDQQATGLFFGDPFTVVDGFAQEGFEEETIRVSLYREIAEGDVCDPINFSKPRILVLFSVPKMVGVYPLSSTQSVTFNDATVTNTVTAEIATCGAIEIISITGNRITGRLDISVEDGENFMNGNFDIIYCQE